MQTFYYDIRHAARGLVRMRGAALIAIAALALGIGATTTMFGVAYAALARPLPFTQPDRLVILYLNRSTPGEGTVRLRWSKPSIDKLQTGEPLVFFEEVASFTTTSVSLSGTGDAEQLDGEIVSPDYFRALRISPTIGHAFLPQEDGTPGAHPVAMLGERLWRRRFSADPAVVGRTVRVNDVALTVVGILPASFAGLNGKSEIWIPRAMAPSLTYSDYLTTPQHFIGLLARLAPGQTIDRANAALAAIGPRLADADSAPGTKWSAMALPIGEARIDPRLRRSVLMLMAAADCVLLIACVNVAGLLVARARRRQREVAIRLAIGSSRRRLVQQLLTESLLLALVAGACGIIAAYWGINLFAQTSPSVIAASRNDFGSFSPFAAPQLDFRVLLFTMAVTLGTTVLCALVPALQAARADVVYALKENERAAPTSRALSGFVVSQIAFAVLLLAAAGLMLDSLQRIQHLRAGFVADNVLTFWIRPPSSRYAPGDGPSIVERILTRIEQTPGVASVAVNRCTPFTGCARTTVFFPDKPVDRMNAPVVGRHYVSADYFQTLGIPLIAGRALTTADRMGRPPVAIVNETAARRFWPGENAVGKHVWFGSSTGFTDPARPVEIVGIAGDVKYEEVDRPLNADFYTSYLQFAYPDTMVMAKLNAPASTVVSAMRRAIGAVDDTVPIFDVQMLDERIGIALSRPRFNATVVTTFAGAALLLSAIGVYGMLAYWVSSRIREIGVRLALGAAPNRVLRLVLGHGLQLTSAGAAIGLVAAVVTGRLLRGWVVGVADPEPPLLAGVCAVMLGVAAVASLIPARRASAVDPVGALRNE